MILIRNVFQAKYGRGKELVALVKELPQMWPAVGERRYCVLTDLSGPFFTVVAEMQASSLAEWERLRDETFSMPAFGEWFSRIQPLVESGSREFYTIEA